MASVDAPPAPSSFRPGRLMQAFFIQAIAMAFIYRRLRDMGAVDLAAGHFNARAPWIHPCGALPHKEFFLLSDRIATHQGTFPGAVHVRGGRIAAMALGDSPTADRRAVAGSMLKSAPAAAAIVDYGSAVIGPGLIDGHVHMNEPGRVEWEGMVTGTKSAAAGGITTVVDMPLNSDPCTTTVHELRRKIAAAREHANKTHVDVAFWAGLVPENARKPAELRALIAEGAVGFKCFMSPSGIDDFANVAVADVVAALPVLRDLGVPLLAHAELVDDEAAQAVQGRDPRAYDTWLDSRPPRFETNAVQALIDAVAALESGIHGLRPAKAGFKVHVVHVSDHGALQLLTAAKARGLAITVETCPHFLQFSAEDAAAGDTRFKCAPPLRAAANREALLAALAAGELDGLASDHSPSPPSLKKLDSGDFLEAWGGIAGLQYSLPASWDAMAKRGMAPHQLHALWSRFPAALAGLSSRKGSLGVGMDADIVVWDPEVEADVSMAALHHKHKVTLYADRKMLGRVVATFVRGSQVFAAAGSKGGESSSGDGGVGGEERIEACGRVVLHRRD